MWRPWVVFAAAAIFPQVQAQLTQTASTNIAPLSEYAIIQRAPDSRVWQREAILTNDDDSLTTNYSSYTELGTGICHIDANGQYVDSVEQVDPVAGGAQAIQGAYQVFWSLNANTPGPAGAVKIVTTDSQQLSSTVFGMAYYDLASGSNAPVAYLQDSIGSIIPPNVVHYANAFSNVTADILYTYTKAGLSQDIVLRQAPLPPDRYGLSDASSVLQIYTEWFNTTDPVATVVTNGNTIDEPFLSFSGERFEAMDSCQYQDVSR
jgi:hypothetical protein